ncbi:hypothetical protein [Luteimicrobium album]|uniref:hypothetical protein n=1 Tax=Luteimicrobium album TaxID=1054550 RepID=UPI0024E13971|nr:hypothetical protein [Luteimicrobium album]
MPLGPTIGRFLAPCGEGVINWSTVLHDVLEHRPELDLTIEGIGPVRAEMPILDQDPVWRAGHLDLSDDELARLRSLADDYADRARAGEAETLEQLRAPRPALPAHEEFVARSAAHLRSVLASLSGEDLKPAPAGAGPQ